jgi:hypothetical protein
LFILSLEGLLPALRLGTIAETQKFINWARCPRKKGFINAKKRLETKEEVENSSRSRETF